MDLTAVADSIKLVAVFFSVVVIAYGGLITATSTNPVTRNEWKEIVTAVLIGISILFLAPWISQNLAGGSYC